MAPYKLLPREVQGVHALIDFLNTKCGIIKMDAKKFAHRLLTSQGIYNLSMLIALVKTKGHEGLNASIDHLLSAKAIAAVAIASSDDVSSQYVLSVSEVSSYILLSTILFVINHVLLPSRFRKN